MLHKRSSTAIRRRQISHAAGRLIVKYGSEHVTIKKISAEIGLSEAAIYRHFKSKRDILALLVDDIESDLLADLHADTVFSLENIEKIFTEHMSGIVKRRGIYFQVIAEIISFGDQGLNKKVYQAVSTYKQRIRDILEGGVKTGAIRSDIDLGVSADLFFGMTQGLVNLWTLSRYSFDLKERYNALWGIFRETVAQD